MRRAVGLPERDGALVRDVEDGLARASAAGIAGGDLIVRAGRHADRGRGRPLGRARGGPRRATVELTVVRGADERQVTVELVAG